MILSKSPAFLHILLPKTGLSRMFVKQTTLEDRDSVSQWKSRQLGLQPIIKDAAFQRAEGRFIDCQTLGNTTGALSSRSFSAVMQIHLGRSRPLPRELEGKGNWCNNEAPVGLCTMSNKAL